MRSYIETDGFHQEIFRFFASLRMIKETLVFVYSIASHRVCICHQPDHVFQWIPCKPLVSAVLEQDRKQIQLSVCTFTLYSWTLPSLPVLLKCSPRSQANTLCLIIPFNCKWFLAGRLLKNERSNVISLPCFKRTWNKIVRNIIFQKLRTVKFKLNVWGWRTWIYCTASFFVKSVIIIFRG